MAHEQRDRLGSTGWHADSLGCGLRIISLPDTIWLDEDSHAQGPRMAGGRQALWFAGFLQQRQSRAVQGEQLVELVKTKAAPDTFLFSSA